MKTSENLALFDVDGTLFGPNYAPDDLGIYQAIETAQEAGWRIGLSSDTPYELLVAWRQQFGMNGPIIAEKGAVVEMPDGDISYDLNDAARFTESRDAVESTLPRAGIPVWSGNSTEAIRTGMIFGDVGQTVVLLNNLGRCGLRFFVRRVSTDGRLVIDDAQTQSVVEQCQQLLPDFNDLVIDVNNQAGIMIAALEKNNKRTGTQKLLGSMGLSRCVMVGNSTSDSIGADIATHYAVGNADEDYKQRADFVTSGTFTKGSIEILAQLTQLIRR